MKFQIGDIVTILHSDEEGEVMDIINDKMVVVRVRGVEFPAYTDQLDFPYFKRFTEQKKKFPDKQAKQYIDNIPRDKKTVAKVADGVWLSFLPLFETDVFGDEVVESFKLHLVNHTHDQYQFSYHLKYFGKKEFDLKNTLYSFTDFYLHDVAFEDLNDSPAFDFVFSLEQPDKKRADAHAASIRLKPKQLFNRIEEMKKKGEAVFTFLLFEQYPDRTVEEKTDAGFSAKPANLYNAAKARQHLQPARSVIDLHIEKLTDNWQQLSNFEMLTLQLKTLEQYIDLAIAHLQPTLIVIHGVGTGRLRDEVHEALKLRPEVKTFVNQFHPLYGYGATEIYFNY
jgi:Smr domain